MYLSITSMLVRFTDQFALLLPFECIYLSIYLSVYSIGYVVGTFAPGRCSDRSQCKFGNSSTEAYICGHHILNTHAAVVDLYRKLYQPNQNGMIGIVLNHDWSEPLTSSQSDKDAAQRANEFKISWFADPLMYGDYPQIMKNNVGERLPTFTNDEKTLVKGSWDVFFLNHY